ncbi:unnamed protein product, partial [Musa acuminata subsp. burmannicoides]
MTAVPSTFKIPRVVDALTLQKQSCRNHALRLRLCQLYVEDETFSPFSIPVRPQISFG